MRRSGGSVRTVTQVASSSQRQQRQESARRNRPSIDEEESHSEQSAAESRTQITRSNSQVTNSQTASISRQKELPQVASQRQQRQESTSSARRTRQSTEVEENQMEESVSETRSQVTRSNSQAASTSRQKDPPQVASQQQQRQASTRNVRSRSRQSTEDEENQMEQSTSETRSQVTRRGDSEAANSQAASASRQKDPPQVVARPVASRRASTVRQKGAGDRNDGVTQFQKGSIVRIKLKDFMTYKNVELFAGPYLNLVLGPNGTGKSALVCALIVGLGGEASTTGRAGLLSEYIRFGCELAVTEIELFNPQGVNFIVRRVFTASQANDSRRKKEFHSTFTWCGREVTKREINEFMKAINVRVENLCQFLPQERVVEFVKMNPKELLENTEKAAGDSQLFDDHHAAAAVSKEIRELKGQDTHLNTEIAKETEIQQRAEEELQRILERDKYKKEIETLDKKIPWIEFEDKRQQYAKSKADFEQKKKEVESEEAILKPIKDKVAKAKKECEKFEKVTRACGEKLSITARQIDPLTKQVENAIEKSVAERNEFVSKKLIEADRKQKLERVQIEINHLQTELDNLQEVDVEPQIQRVSKRIEEIDKELRKMSNEKRKMQMEMDELKNNRREGLQQKEKLSNLHRQRLERLGELNSNARRACDWLEKNQKLFDGQVYPPIMTQINVKRQEWAKFVESAVAKRDLESFVFEDPTDLKKFAATLKHELNIEVNMVRAPRESSDDFPAENFRELKKFGVFSSIKDMFTAPDSVMSYLCKNYHLQMIPVGNEQTDKHIEQIFNEDVRRVYTKTNQYTVKISRYDREMSTTTSRIPESRFLNVVIDEERLGQLNERIRQIEQKLTKIQENVTQLDEEERKIQDEMSKCQQEKKELFLKKNQRKHLETKINQKNIEYKRLEAESIDMNKLRAKVCKEIKKWTDSQMKSAKKLNELIEEVAKKYREKSEAAFKESFARKLHLFAEREYREAEERFKHLHIELKRVESQLRVLKDEARQYRERAVEKSGFDWNNLTQELKQAFQGLPDTIDEIHARKQTLVLRVESIMDADETIREDYDQRRKRIEKKKNESKEKQRILREKMTRLETIKNRWLPKLEELIGRINDNFSRFMARLNCAGEVGLYQGSEPDCFDEYGIQIKVKFRDSEQLQELSSLHQSGGERSVSTMIYMIALQELTRVPFRCVDEINQGMDEANERSVFDLISETSSNSSSQYFLFSPKLLHSLTYTEKMKIHIICNGPQFKLDWNQVNWRDQ